MQKIFWLLLLVGVIGRVVISRPDFINGQKIKITTKITSEPVVYDTAQGINVYGLLAYVPTSPQIHYGDEIIIEGIVKDGKLVNPHIVSIKETQNDLYQFREKLISFFEQSLPQPHSGLLSGIVLGSKRGLSQEFWEKLKTTGTAHVVVASGMNITFFAGFVMMVLLNFLSRPKAASVAVGSIWLYSILSGFDAPIVRASIMGSITFAAMILGRVNIAWRALFLSGFVMLLINPLWVEDIGFWLSFAATGSLLLFEKKVSTKLSFVPKIFREGLSTSLAAQVGVAPILLLSFGQFNIFSPLINALILWSIPGIMIIGSISALIGLIVPQLGQLVLYLVYPLTWFFVSVVDIFS